LKNKTKKNKMTEDVFFENQKFLLPLKKNIWIFKLVEIFKIFILKNFFIKLIFNKFKSNNCNWFYGIIICEFDYNYYLKF
jgi:hypothetical protein